MEYADGTLIRNLNNFLSLSDVVCHPQILLEMAANKGGVWGEKESREDAKASQVRRWEGVGA